MSTVRVARTLLVLALGAMTVLLGWGVGRLQSQPQPKAPLELSLSVGKESFLVGEPVLIQQQLINQSDKELTIDLTASPNRFQTQIAAGDGPFQPYTSLSAKVLRFIRISSVIITLKPGEKREDKGFVLFNAATNDYAFPAAGSYRLKIDFFYDREDKSKKVASNVLEIKVVAPEREVDQMALKFIIDNQLKPFLNPSEATFAVFEQEDVNKILLQLKELSKQFPESAYAPYARQVFGILCQGREQELSACVPPER